MKEALDIFRIYVNGHNLSAHVVANVHDEWQVEAKDSLTDTVGAYGVKSIIEAGTNLNLKCPLDGEYKIGDNWSETH
jgi:DNA polymerase I-like protein with 3'-5' exonuclease and polymerase domains